MIRERRSASHITVRSFFQPRPCRKRRQYVLSICVAMMIPSQKQGLPTFIPDAEAPVPDQMLRTFLAPFLICHQNESAVRHLRPFGRGNVQIRSFLRTQLVQCNFGQALTGYSNPKWLLYDGIFFVVNHLTSFPLLLT